MNFLDVYRRRAGESRVPGVEGAGVVRALGPGADFGVAVGDRVGWVLERGSYAERMVCRAERLIPLPGDIEDRVVAAVLLQGLTAQYLTSRSHAVRRGDRVLVHAAAGGVGLLLVQLAKAAGAVVLGTVSSAAKAAMARQAGADHLIRYDREDFAECVRELTDGRGVDVVYDSVNRATLEDSMRAVARHGTVVVFGEASGQADPIPPKRLQEHGSIRLTYPSLAHFIATREELLALSASLFDAVRGGVLRVDIGCSYSLEDASRAHADLEGRRSIGKLVLLPRAVEAPCPA